MKSNWIKVRGIGKLIHPTYFLEREISMLYSKIQLVPSQPGTLVQARLYDCLETTVDPRVQWRTQAVFE